mmetsp:Transcript_16040/g.39434  ORF Transcript_16040/g.39434 Transcript_16040/m.39434 type:complete len:239 (-) Transcript_16040:220-936(-)
MAPTWIESRDKNSMPCRANTIPRALLASQCFSKTYHAQKPTLTAPLSISATVGSTRCGASVMKGILGKTPKYICRRATDLGMQRPSTGAMVAVRATKPSSTKYPVRILLTRSLGRNLKSRKKLKSTQLPMMGKRMASCFVIASVCPAATGRTERWAPANTASVAVARMLKLASTPITIGATASSSRAAWDRGAARYRASSSISFSASAFATAARVPATILVCSCVRATPDQHYHRMGM